MAVCLKMSFTKGLKRSIIGAMLLSLEASPGYWEKGKGLRILGRSQNGIENQNFHEDGLSLKGVFFGPQSENHRVLVDCNLLNDVWT